MFASRTLQQLGQHMIPADAPELMYFTWPDVLESLDEQLSTTRQFGGCKNAGFSMLTDGRSGPREGRGVSEAALRHGSQANSVSYSCPD